MAECQGKEISVESFKFCPNCKNTLDQPMRLKCMHSFCKTCLDKSPRIEQSGKIGWRCQSCDFFTNEVDAREDKLLESLILREKDKKNIKENDQICQICQKNKFDLKFCRECLLPICGECKILHQRIPATKYHVIECLEGHLTSDIIDEIYYCSKHENHVLDNYCRTCEEIVCKQCLPSHNKHDFQISREKLLELNTHMEEYTKSLSSKLEIANMQIEVLNKEINNVKERYARWRIESDMKLEMLFNRLKATKAVMDERVNEEETKNLEELMEIKSQIQNQAERFKIASDLSNLTKEKTKNLSQLMQLQSGLYEYAKELSKIDIVAKKFYQTIPYINDELYEYTEDELKQILRPVSFENTSKFVNEIRIESNKNLQKEVKQEVELKQNAVADILLKQDTEFKQLQYMCEDFDAYFRTQLRRIQTTKISNTYSNRIIFIQGTIYIASVDVIKQYNANGTCVNISTNKHDAFVINQTYNGDILAATDSGLYMTNKELSQWHKLRIGNFSDIAIHGNKFTVLDYKLSKLYTYHYVTTDNRNQWELSSSFDIEKYHWGHFGGNETIIVDKCKNVIVCRQKMLLVYSANGKHIRNIVAPGSDYNLTGMDRNGKIILCEFKTGKLYGINNIQEMDPKNMEQYFVYQTMQCIRDLAIDYEGNLWTLTGDKSCYLTKYEPIK